MIVRKKQRESEEEELEKEIFFLVWDTRCLETPMNSLARDGDGECAMQDLFLHEWREL